MDGVFYITDDCVEPLELFPFNAFGACASLSESVVEQIFLLTVLPLESRARASGDVELKDFLGGRDACGLAWISPVHDYRPGISDKTHSTWNRFPVVDTPKPTLAWEAFPRDNDRRADTLATLSGISKICYDLRVRQVVTDAPPRLIYERRDLPVPSHTLEQTFHRGLVISGVRERASCCAVTFIVQNGDTSAPRTT